MNRSLDDMSRRAFFQLGGALAAAAVTGVAAGSGLAQAAMIGMNRKADLPRAKGPRLLVVGGGTSGLTIAKYAKRHYPKFDVVLIEKRDMYASCFGSNLLYSNLVDLDFLADHSFLDAAVANRYTFFNATATGLDRVSRKLLTSEGEIGYDFLVLAPGISYDYTRIGVEDPETEYALRQHAPAGFISPMEHVTIRRMVRDFAGGTFVVTVPGGNYRCLAGPYERACMIASAFRKNKVKGKVLVLDHNPHFTIAASGFGAAFKELYGDVVEYLPSTEIKGVDPRKRQIRTEFDTIDFDAATIYPGVRGSTLIERLGLMDPRSPQKEALIDDHKYHFIGDERVYVTGDSRPMGFSKSANTANTEGKYVARLLAARAQGKDIDWVSPVTLCLSMVNADPAEAISVSTGYTYDEARRAFGFSRDATADERRDAIKAHQLMEWCRSLYRDLLA